MKHLAKLIVPLALSLPLTASAADPLPKQVADLERLVGKWKGKGSMTMGKDSASIAGTWSCKRTSAQFGVLCTFHLTGIPGVAAYEETDLMGYEPNSSTYHWYSVTNAGETHDHVAHASSGNAMKFVFESEQNGQPLKEVIELSFSENSKQVTGRAETFLGGRSISVMQLEMRK